METNARIFIQSRRIKPTIKGLQPYINALRTAEMKEGDAGNDVMTVGNSGSSIIVWRFGRIKQRREKRIGKEGGVVKLVFLTGFISPENVSLITSFGGTAPN